MKYKIIQSDSGEQGQHMTMIKHPPGAPFISDSAPHHIYIVAVIAESIITEIRIGILRGEKQYILHVQQSMCAINN